MLSRRGLGARKWGPAAATRGGTTERRCVKQKTHKQPLWEAASLESRTWNSFLASLHDLPKVPPRSGLGREGGERRWSGLVAIAGDSVGTGAAGAPQRTGGSGVGKRAHCRYRWAGARQYM